MFGIEFGDNIFGYSVIGLYAQHEFAFVLAHAIDRDMPYATWKVYSHGLYMDCRMFPNLSAAYTYLHAQLSTDIFMTYRSSMKSD